MNMGQTQDVVNHAAKARKVSPACGCKRKREGSAHLETIKVSCLAAMLTAESSEEDRPGPGADKDEVGEAEHRHVQAPLVEVVCVDAVRLGGILETDCEGEFVRRCGKAPQDQGEESRRTEDREEEARVEDEMTKRDPLGELREPGPWQAVMKRVVRLDGADRARIVVLLGRNDGLALGPHGFFAL